MEKIAAVALCNNHSQIQDWFHLCIGTWKNNLVGIDKYFVSDGTLNLDQQREIEILSGGKFRNTDFYQDEINSVLERYPSIKRQRDLCVFYKRIVDFSICFSDYDRILSLDTDIGVIAPVQLPSSLPDFAFCVDDVPGYSADPKVVFETKLVTGLNAGFLIFRPSLIDFDFIEYVTDKYIKHGKINWWSEQTCWALIAGHLCKDVQVFSSNSVAIISGLNKRNINRIRANRTSYIVPSKKIKDLRYIQEIIGDAKVIHFAGPGKPWIKPVMENTIVEKMQDDPEILRLDSIPYLPWNEKVLLFSRLFIQKYK
jgi:hypothetical protein